MLDLGNQIRYSDFVGTVGFPDISIRRLADHLIDTRITELRTSLAGPLLWRLGVTLDTSLRELDPTRRETHPLDVGTRVEGSDGLSLKTGVFVMAPPYVIAEISPYAQRMIKHRVPTRLLSPLRSGLGSAIEASCRARH